MDSPDATVDQGALLGLLDRVPEWMGDPSVLTTGPWTNWYRAPLQEGLIKLAVMRNLLEIYALHDVHLEGRRVGNDVDTRCGTDTAQVRTIDGTCNDPFDPRMGAAGSRIARNLPLDASWPDEATLMDPDPRALSRELFTREDFQPIDTLNLLAVAWIQFEIHDWFSHGDNLPTDWFSVPLSEDDPFRERGLSELLILKSTPDPTRLPEEASLPPTYVNEVTHWWDASQIYGSDLETADALRTFDGGRLRVDDGMLPAGPDDRSLAGFTRNWWLGLELMHTLFVLEHNAIADHLALAHPDWSDQKLYDTTRMVNAAVIAKIHTLEWTPAILPNPTLQVAMHSNWSGLNQFVQPPLPPGNDPVLDGVRGNPRELPGAPYALTEEFVAVYRMHPLLPDVVAGVPLEATLDGDARAIVATRGMSEVARRFAAERPGALTLGNYPALLQALELPGGVVTDLGTVDLLRDRERGVPRYNEVRRHLLLPPVPSFEALTDDPVWQEKLERLYDGDIEKVDLLVGTLAEATRPTCYHFGETLFQVFTLMATVRLQGDRFYTDLYTPEVYSVEGLEWIEEATLAGVLLRHFPELADDGLTSDRNAFFPW